MGSLVVFLRLPTSRKSSATFPPFGDFFSLCKLSSFCNEFSLTLPATSECSPTASKLSPPEHLRLTATICDTSTCERSASAPSPILHPCSRRSSTCVLALIWPHQISALPPAYFGSLFNPSLNNKVSQSSSSNLSHSSPSSNLSHSSPSSNLSHSSTSSQSVERQQKHTSQRTIGASPERDPRSKPEKGSFDIFRTTNVGLVKLQKPLHVLNKEKKRDSERFKNAPEPQYLRSGMVLLKNFISNAVQVKVLNKCRELGIGGGGFYRPGYRNGTKLHLQMMCLGKDWDPDSKLYKDSRLFDGAVPPEIPEEFKKLVDGALHTAHNFLRRSSKGVEEIPNMSPDVCIVNFYDNSGKLGLHQDIDESKESLAKKLPVVSLSVGDSAEFLYGDVRDADKAEKVILESGDVLIFGGKSRLIFHGVASVKPDTAPTFLTNETAVRPGRLNLTFRQV